jgi:hypothetical protein
VACGSFRDTSVVTKRELLGLNGGTLVNLVCIISDINLFLNAFAKLWKTNTRFVMSVRPSVRPYGWNNSSPTGQIFIKFDIGVFFENLSIKFKFH